jgi:hypothetical protein
MYVSFLDFCTIFYLIENYVNTGRTLYLRTPSDSEMTGGEEDRRTNVKERSWKKVER